MWELRNDDGPRQFTCGKRHTEERCKICGQHFKEGDKQYLIVCLSSKEAREANLSNMMTHVGCWDEFCTGLTTDTELVSKLLRHKQPKASALTEEQNKHIEAFKQAASEYGYRVESKTRQGAIRMTKRGTTMSVVYNPYSGSVTYEDRRKDNLFKGMFDRQVSVNIYNRMHAILGDGKHDDYSALGIINKAVEDVNKMFE